MVEVQRVKLAYNNVYILDDADARILIDTGPDYPGAFASIETALEGRLPDAVIATHGHIDHASLGSEWAAKGIPVYAGGDDLPLCQQAPVTLDHEYEGMIRWLRESGAPADIQAEVLASIDARRVKLRTVYQRDAPHEPPVERGNWPTPLRFRPYIPNIAREGRLHEMPTLSIVLAPGHTPGNLVLVHDSGLLFSGDQLLPDITPTPAIQGKTRAVPGGDWRLRTLPLFNASLQRLSNMTFTRCYPGHGEPFDAVRETIELNLSQIADRSRKVQEAIDESGPGTLYEIAERIYPRALRRRFWQICSTLQGNLDILEAEGQVTRDSDTRWARPT